MHIRSGRIAEQIAEVVQKARPSETSDGRAPATLAGTTHPQRWYSRHAPAGPAAVVARERGRPSRGSLGGTWYLLAPVAGAGLQGA